MTFVGLNFLLAAIAIGFALRYGGKTERIGAAAMIAVAVVAIGGQLTIERRYTSVDPVGLAQDLIAFSSLAFLGIYSKRVWPLWAAALQLLSLGAHCLRALDIPVRPVVYAWMKTGPTWAVYFLLIIGTLLHLRRTRIAASARSSRG